MSTRVYRGLMRVFLPHDIRHRYGDDMTELFAARRRDASGSWSLSVRVWLRAAWDLARHGTAQRLQAPGHFNEPQPPSWRRWFVALLRDARFAGRVLRANPVFTVVAILTLALGIGATTAMFSVVNTVLLTPLPYPDSDRLVFVQSRDTSNGETSPVNAPGNFTEWTRRSDSFDALATLGGDLAVLSGTDETRRLFGIRSAGSMMQVLGLDPIVGRPLTPDDDLSGESVVVISHALWQTAFGGDSGVVGTGILLDGQPHTVVGVMPAGFGYDYFWSRDVDFWSTSAWTPEYRESRTNYAHPVIGRLADGVSLAQAQEEMDAIAAQLQEEHPETNRNSGVHLVSAHADLVADSAGALRLLMGAVALVLLIAAVNIANLLLARATAREQEIAVRKALGATHGQLAAQVLVESLLLGLLGGAAGLLVAYGSLELIVGLGWNVPNLAAATIDGRVLAFTFLVALATGVGFGVLPALRLARGDAADRLRSGRGDAGGGTTSWSALVVLEVALAVVLLVGAGLLLRTFLNLASVDPGFRAEGLLTFAVAMPPGQDEEARKAAWRQFDAEIASLPGVGRASRASQFPSEGNRMSGWFNFVDRPVDNSDRSFLVPYRLVSDAYFEILEIPLLAGRSFGTAEVEGLTEVVINEAARQRFWGDDDPLGDVVGIGSRTELFLPPGTVVGVVADVRNQGVSSEAAPAVYFPVRDAESWSNISFVLEVADETDVVPALRARLQAIEPNATIYAVRTVQEMLADQLAPTRSILWLSGAFALVGLAMAGIGVFGLLSFSVNRRTAEIGIRIALGADAARLVRLVVRQALARVVLGTAIGLVAAALATRLMQTLLFGVTGTDPVTLASVCAVLLAIALLAAYLPARRASRVSPTSALRAQ